MRSPHVTMLTVLAVTLAGCATSRRGVDDTSLQTPAEIMLGKAGGPARGPVKLRSGQAFIPPRCCPPLELRDAKGNAAQEFDVTAGEQRLAVPAGAYSLVGHDPGGEECVLRLEVTNE